MQAHAHATATAVAAANTAHIATLQIQSWPADLPAQVRAVSQVLTAATSPLTLPALEAHFKGRGPWKNSLPRILETLQVLGKAQTDGQAWRS